MKYLQALLIAFGIFFWTSCEDDDPIINESEIVLVSEDITAVTTWSGDKIYVIMKSDFWVYNTLLIEPGCIIKFHPSGGITMTLGSGGTVNANGSSTDPIIFTSWKDDAHGGDNNQDATATSPAAKDWSHVNLNGENGSLFNYCEFYYGGKGSFSYTLSLESGSIATVSNCLFVNNDGSDNSGDYCVLAANEASVGTIIQDNTFYNNSRPLGLSVNLSLDATNTFSNPNNSSETNTYNAIFVETIDELTTHVSWSETEVPFVVWDNDWWLESGSTLTLSNNTILKFRPGSSVVLADGLSNIVNYDGSGVFFTSYKDDAHGGDTNADGTATTASNGDWDGIYDNTLTLPSPYYYTWANILYDNY